MDGGDSWLALGSDDDRAWFAVHPRRSYRLCRSYPDDLRPGWTIVRQVEPGLRIRALVRLDTDTPRHDEANARRLFEQVNSTGEARRIIRAIEGLAR